MRLGKGLAYQIQGMRLLKISGSTMECHNYCWHNGELGVMSYVCTTNDIKSWSCMYIASCVGAPASWEVHDIIMTSSCHHALGYRANNTGYIQVHV